MRLGDVLFLACTLTLAPACKKAPTLDEPLGLCKSLEQRALVRGCAAADAQTTAAPYGDVGDAARFTVGAPAAKAEILRFKKPAAYEIARGKAELAATSRVFVVDAARIVLWFADDVSVDDAAKIAAAANAQAPMTPNVGGGASDPAAGTGGKRGGTARVGGAGVPRSMGGTGALPGSDSNAGESDASDESPAALCRSLMSSNLAGACAGIEGESDAVSYLSRTPPADPRAVTFDEAVVRAELRRFPDVASLDDALIRFASAKKKGAYYMNRTTRLLVFVPERWDQAKVAAMTGALHVDSVAPSLLDTLAANAARAATPAFELPTYPRTANVQRGAVGPSIVLRYETPDTPDAVTRWYRGRLGDFTANDAPAAPGGACVELVREQKRIRVTAEPDRKGGVTHVVVVTMTGASAGSAPGDGGARDVIEP